MALVPALDLRPAPADTLPPLVALEIADALMNGGFVGVTLAKLLREKFGGASRYEVFLGVAIFATDAQVELLMADAEIADLRRQLAGPLKEAA